MDRQYADLATTIRGVSAITIPRLIGYSARSKIWQDGDIIPSSYSYVDGHTHHLTLFENVYDVEKQRLKQEQPNRTNPFGVVELELYRINYGNFNNTTKFRDMKKKIAIKLTLVLVMSLMETL